jgi:hypothetical protein
MEFVLWFMGSKTKSNSTISTEESNTKTNYLLELHQTEF